MQSQEFCTDSANVVRRGGEFTFPQSYAFADFYDLVAGDVFEALHQAARSQCGNNRGEPAIHESVSQEESS
jgi:hypothetical protein